MNLKIKLTAALIMVSSVSTAQASIKTYDVEGVFFEPLTQSIGNTIFTGSFGWDSDTLALSNLHGVMNSSMVSTVQDLSLSYHLATSIDQSGLVTASVFRKNTTNVFAYGGYTKGDYLKYGVENFGGVTDGNVANENAYFSFTFDSATMSAVLDPMRYGDCSLNGLMQQVCMTGHSTTDVGHTGTMAAYPMSLSISEVSAVPVPAAAWLFGGALVSLIGANRRKNVLPV